MLFTLIFLLNVASFCFALFVLNRNKNARFRRPPGPKGLPLIGNLHQFDTLAPHITLAKLTKSHGPIMTLKLGFTTVVVVQSAKMAKEVLKTQDLNFCNRPIAAGTQKLSYNGLDIAFCQYNEYFREVKKLIVVHLLSSKRVKSFEPVRNDEISRLLNRISSLSGDSKAVNLNELFMSFTISNICRMAFSRRYEDGPSNKFHSLLNETQTLFTTFFFADFFPCMGWLDKLCGNTSRLEKAFKAWDAFYEELINEHLDPNMSFLQQEDFIDVLLQLRKESFFSFDLSFDHIKALLMDIFIAGTDTSAAMLVWVMTELIKNPTSMKKVQDELRNRTENNGYVNLEDVQNLEYFKAVIKETFRLHPGIPLLAGHLTIKETKLEGYNISPNTLVCVNVWAIGRDHESWKNPEMFIPERFIGSSVDYKGHDFEFIPFGSGRRMCPGLHLATASIELALANMLYSFDWELPVGVKKEDVDTDTLPGLTLQKKNPLCLIARKFTGI